MNPLFERTLETVHACTVSASAPFQTLAIDSLIYVNHVTGTLLNINSKLSQDPHRLLSDVWNEWDDVPSFKPVIVTFTC